MELSLLSIIHGRVADIGYSLVFAVRTYTYTTYYFPCVILNAKQSNVLQRAVCVCARANYMAPKTGNMILLIEKYNEEMKETTHDCRATIIN